MRALANLAPLSAEHNIKATSKHLVLMWPLFVEDENVSLL